MHTFIRTFTTVDEMLLTFRLMNAEQLYMLDNSLSEYIEELEDRFDASRTSFNSMITLNELLHARDVHNAIKIVINEI